MTEAEKKSVCVVEEDRARGYTFERLKRLKIEMKLRRVYTYIEATRVESSSHGCLLCSKTKVGVLIGLVIEFFESDVIRFENGQSIYRNEMLRLHCDENLGNFFFFFFFLQFGM